MERDTSSIERKPSNRSKIYALRQGTLSSIVISNVPVLAD